MEIVFLLLNNCDFEKARTTNASQKQFFLDVDPPNYLSRQLPFNMAEDYLKEGKRRILKVHSPSQFIQKPVTFTNSYLVSELQFPFQQILFTYLQLDDAKAKFVLVVRNPKDTAVSFYNFHKTARLLRESFNPANFDEFFERFKGALSRN